MDPEASALINRYWIGNNSWELRHRTEYGAFGIGVHNLIHDADDRETIRNGFASDCDSWIQDLNAHTAVYGPGTVRWVGEVGIYADKPGMHGIYRAFDLTAIDFSNGDRFDANVSWRSGTEGKRLYIGVAAMCRRHFGTVLTAWWDPDHTNHIHFDNQFGPGPLDTGDRDDTCIVQAAAVFLNGESIAIDGSWGPATQDAYLRLMNDFNMKCYDPKTNASHAQAFFRMIAQHGFDNRAAGAYQASCS